MTTTKGSSADKAKEIVSLFNANPGPLVPVTASFPVKDAPTAEAAAAISSSAWKVRTLKFLCFDNSCNMSDAGVIG